MFAMAHAKHIFTVSVSFLWSCLSLFFTSQCLKYVLCVSYWKGNKISQFHMSQSLVFVTRCSESIRIPSIQFVIILVSSLLMNFSFVFIFKMIYAYFWVCFGFVFAKINCTFMFAMAHAKHIFTVSVSCLWFRLSLFLMSQCLKDVLHVSNLKGNEISQFHESQSLLFLSLDAVRVQAFPAYSL